MNSSDREFFRRYPYLVECETLNGIRYCFYAQNLDVLPLNATGRYWVNLPN